MRGVNRRPPAVIAVVLLAVTLVTATTSASVAARAQRPTTPDRATWVWDRPDPATLVQFLTAHSVDDVFVSTPGDLASASDLGWFQRLRARTRAAGIRMYALGAETSWVDDIPAALAWQRQALATGLFDGIHVDVEPWQHAGWSTERPALLGRYVDLLGQLAADTTAPVEADISFWLDQYSVGGQRVDEAVIARVDAVTVMSYRDTVTGPDSITAVAARAVDAATRAGKPVRLAIETHDLGSDPVSLKQTFYGSTQKALDKAMAGVDAAEGSRSYSGVAVHDYTGWAALRAR